MNKNKISLGELEKRLAEATDLQFSEEKGQYGCLSTSVEQAVGIMDEAAVAKFAEAWKVEKALELADFKPIIQEVKVQKKKKNETDISIPKALNGEILYIYPDVNPSCSYLAQWLIGICNVVKSIYGEYYIYINSNQSYPAMVRGKRLGEEYDGLTVTIAPWISERERE